MMILRLSCPQQVRRAVRSNAKRKIRSRPEYMNLPHPLDLLEENAQNVSIASSAENDPFHRRAGHDFPANRPIRNSKNRAESTSTATLVFGTNLSRTTGEVLVLAKVGAEPRIDMLVAASFSAPGRLFKSPAVGL